MRTTVRRSCHVTAMMTRCDKRAVLPAEAFVIISQVSHTWSIIIMKSDTRYKHKKLCYREEHSASVVLSVIFDISLQKIC